MALFFIIFFAVYGAANFYIFLRGWQALSSYPIIKPFYIVIFLISVSAYILSRVIGENIPAWSYDILLWIGSFWFAFMLYFFLFIVLIDLSRVLNHFFKIYPAIIMNNFQTAKEITAISVLLITLLIVAYGYINTRNIVVNTREIILPKKSSTLNELNVVVAADFHMTPVNDGKLLKQIVQVINGLDPDVVLMPGDIVDDKVKILKARNIGADLKNIKSKYGVFASPGNHEFISGIKEAIPYLESLNIKVLRDTFISTGHEFQIVGRDDRSKTSFTKEERKSLKEITKNIDNNLPIFLLDHTPLGLEEAVQNGVDLQLSGHTHHGQMFPNNLITNMIYEVSWGYLRKENTQFYVTCGVGTWGPPVRIGSDAEVVNLKIKFVE